MGLKASKKWPQASKRYKSCLPKGGGWIGVCKSTNPLWFINQICHSIFALNPKSGQKYYFELHAKSKIPAQKIDESTICCNWRTQKSVKILLWIQNPGKNIFKFRQSVHLFTPLPKDKLEFKFFSSPVKYVHGNQTSKFEIFFTWSAGLTWVALFPHRTLSH